MVVIMTQCLPPDNYHQKAPRKHGNAATPLAKLPSIVPSVTMI